MPAGATAMRRLDFQAHSQARWQEASAPFHVVLTTWLLALLRESDLTDRWAEASLPFMPSHHK